MPGAPFSTGAEASPVIFAKYDVVQINNPEHINYGMFFIVGDSRNGKLHGFAISDHRKKEYLTVPEKDCHRIGVSKVRSTKTCSDKWISDCKA